MCNHQTDPNSTARSTCLSVWLMQLVKAMARHRGKNLTSHSQHDTAAAAASLPSQQRLKAEHTCELRQAELVAGPVELVIQQQQPAPRRDEAQPTHTNLWGHGGGAGRWKEGEYVCHWTLSSRIRALQASDSTWLVLRHLTAHVAMGTTGRHCKHTTHAGATITLEGGKG